MEYQRPNLNTFTVLLTLRSWNFKSRMRHSARPSVKLRVEALDQDHLIRGQIRFVEPPITRKYSSHHFNGQK